MIDGSARKESPLARAGITPSYQQSVPPAPCSCSCRHHQAIDISEEFSDVPLTCLQLQVATIQIWLCSMLPPVFASSIFSQGFDHVWPCKHWIYLCNVNSHVSSTCCSCAILRMWLLSRLQTSSLVTLGTINKTLWLHGIQCRPWLHQSCRNCFLILNRDFLPASKPAIIIRAPGVEVQSARRPRAHLGAGTQS